MSADAHDTGSYSGRVSPGGPPEVRELDALRITKVAVDEQMSNNCYVLTCLRTGAQVLLDAADEAGTLLALVGDGGLTHVVTTHQHWDHHRALAAVVAATGARTVAGDADAEAIHEQTGIPVAERVNQGDTIPVGECTLEVIALAGHTPGSIALLYEDPTPGGHPHLFTGDSLFPGGAGRTTSPEDFRRLMDDLEARVFDRLPDSTWFYPGHGDDSTLGSERRSIPEWRARGW